MLPLASVAVLVPALALADGDGATVPSPAAHREIPDDPYVPASRADLPRSPGIRFSSGTFLAVQVNVDALGQNIVGDAANEPSIAVDPVDPDRMVIGWRQFDTIASNFRQAGWGYTTDGGLTWTFPGVIEPGIFRSDPVLDSDAIGWIYYNSLTVNGSTYTCDVFRSSDDGASWDPGVFAQGGDKQWMTIDKSGGPGDGHVYSTWNSVFSSCSPGFFTRSTNGGASYEACSSIPGNPYWGTMTVDPSGRLFVVGVSGSNFQVARSTNAQDAGLHVSWELSTTFSLGGSVSSSTGPNPGGLLGQVDIAVDPAPAAPGNTRVYALCSVNPSGADPLDVMFARSTDGGATWSPPVRVNDDPGTAAWQWFGTMSVAPSGRIDAVWLDTRDDPGTYFSSLYYSFSTDGGVTWSVNEQLSGSFDPHVGWPQQSKMGDYFDMESDDLGFNLAWAATFNGEQDVYFGRKGPSAVAAGEGPDPVPVALLHSEPNPFRLGTDVRFRIPRDAFVTLRVYDALGRNVATLVEGDRPAGWHRTRFEGRDLPSGVYFYRLTAGGVRVTEKAVLLR